MLTKKAVIIIGEHLCGKSRTINILKEHLLEFENPKRTNIFTLENGDEVYIYSQTLQEKNDTDTERLINRLEGEYKYIILPSRPMHDPSSKDVSLIDIIKVLHKNKYEISYLTIKGNGARNYGYYVSKAEDILDLLNIELI